MDISEYPISDEVADFLIGWETRMRAYIGSKSSDQEANESSKITI